MKLITKAISQFIYGKYANWLILILAAIVFALLGFNLGKKDTIDLSAEKIKNILVIGTVVIAFLLFFVSIFTRYVVLNIQRNSSIRDRHASTINALITHVNRIYSHLGISPAPDGASETSAASYWPWGSHHTENLAHLEAAAKRFWTLYDPDDSTTAPTNEVVAEWLQAERGVSKDKAKAIASILRADGLPTGRRG